MTVAEQPAARAAPAQTLHAAAALLAPGEL
jgi:hypothetical protein